jgi:uncharacterized protein (TIGR03067 family)
MWQVPSGKELRRFEGHEQRTAYLAFSPNGLTLISGSEDKTVRLWDIVTGKEIRAWSGHESATGPVAFSPDGRKVASGSFDGTVFIWDVTTAVVLPEISAHNLDQLWDDLGSFNAGEAHGALWAMAGRSRDSVPFLKQRLSPVPVPDDRRIEQLIAELNDDQFAKRQKALRALEEIAEVAEPHLRMALKSGSQTLEGRRRIEALLDALSETSSKMVRQRRAVAVLEAIGNTDAKAILELLAGGPKEVRLTRESCASLNRLKAVKESPDNEAIDLGGLDSMALAPEGKRVGVSPQSGGRVTIWNLNSAAPVETAFGPDTDETKKELTKLQGVWRVVSSQVGDEKAPPDEVKRRKVTIKGNVLNYEYGNEQNDKREGTIKVDPKTKAFDWTWVSPEPAPTMLGIYELQGDDLKIGFPNDGPQVRPTRFVIGKNDVVWLLVLKRAGRK